MYFYLASYFFFGVFRGFSALARRPNFAYPFVLFVLFLLTAFRFSVGCDWDGYYFNYAAARFYSAESIPSLTDAAWWAWLAVIHALDLSYPTANLLPAILLFLGLNHLARRQADPTMVLIIAFPIVIMGLGMSGIRQGAAFGLLCYAITALGQRQPLRFTVFVLLASLWHSSAISFFLLLPLFLARNARVQVLLVVALSIPIGALLVSTEAAEVAVGRYTGGQADVATGAILRLGTVCATGLLYWFVLRNRWRVARPHDQNLFDIFALVMIAAPVLILFSSVIADRMGYYLMIPQLVIIGMVPALMESRNRVLMQVGVYTAMAGYFVIWTSLSPIFESCYAPYQSWIFGSPGPII